MSSEMYDATELFINEPVIRNLSDEVQIRVYCEVDPVFCAKVENTLISAVNQFADVVILKNQIVFQLSYYSFCRKQCANTTFGLGAPGSQFTYTFLEETDANFIYPQALAKQIAEFPSTLKWVHYDLAIDINHDIYMNALNPDELEGWDGEGMMPKGGYWFKNDSSIEDYQVDLEYVILHQMMHGLGMVSSWAPYFSDRNSPFNQLLQGIITTEDSLKIMTPSPYWHVKHQTGPTYITGFQPNMIFDKFLYLSMIAKNETVWLGDIGFEMQSFCLQDHEAFAVNFMNAFLNNATQSSRAKSVYVSMSYPETLTFRFDHLVTNDSQFLSNPYLRETYSSMLMMTGPEILERTATSEKNMGHDFYQPGVITSHVDDRYRDTPDFLMTHTFMKGKTLQSLVDGAYANIPVIKYNVTKLVEMNVTLHSNSTVGNTTTRIEHQLQTVEQEYRSAIGPGLLRILEAIGYPTVLTESSSVIKSNKPENICDDDYHARSDDNLITSDTLSIYIRHQLPYPMLLFIFMNLVHIII
ncbi:hypothetical protein BDB01DRAFT_776682 [Pilobolus umbonatus]|nr:hypothetical protein BDB01DRAFT_776682 [Pilobolus umbonatus]